LKDVPLFAPQRAELSGMEMQLDDEVQSVVQESRSAWNPLGQLVPHCVKLVPQEGSQRTRLSGAEMQLVPPQVVLQ
jgi:hypothetical protein